MMLSKYIINNRFNWTCLGLECPTNCCAHMSVEKSHLVSLFNLPANLIPLSGDNHARLCGSVSRDRLTNVNGMHFINCDDAGRCSLLQDDGGCTIYDLRGSSCRSYPLFIDKYSGVCIDETCPGFGRGWTSLEDLKVMLDHLFNIHLVHKSYFDDWFKRVTEAKRKV